jgi:hypothetical protein
VVVFHTSAWEPSPARPACSSKANSVRLALALFVTFLVFTSAGFLTPATAQSDPAPEPPTEPGTTDDRTQRGTDDGGDGNSLLFLALGISGLALVVAVSALLSRRQSVATRSDLPQGQSWTARAEGLTVDLSSLLSTSAIAKEDDPDRPLEGAGDKQLADGLRGLVPRLTAMTTAAPTCMDARVSRAVAVHARALLDVLEVDEQHTRDEGGRQETPPGASRQAMYRRRSKELRQAARDLDRHLELFGEVSLP